MNKMSAKVLLSVNYLTVGFTVGKKNQLVNSLERFFCKIYIIISAVKSIDSKLCAMVWFIFNVVL